jgi:hypothetical protein
VRREPLEIEKSVAVVTESLDQTAQCDLGRVGRFVEHRLAEEGSAEAHPVEATRQPFALPDLHRVGEPGVVQVTVRRDNLLIDPVARVIRTRCACEYDFTERCVDRGAELALPQHAAQTSRHMKPVERKNPTLFR